MGQLPHAASEHWTLKFELLCPNVYMSQQKCRCLIVILPWACQLRCHQLQALSPPHHPCFSRIGQSLGLICWQITLSRVSLSWIGCNSMTVIFQKSHSRSIQGWRRRLQWNMISTRNQTVLCGFMPTPFCCHQTETIYTISSFHSYLVHLTRCIVLSASHTI